MIEEFDQSPYTKKAFELAYVMIRVARTVKSKNTSDRLDTFAHQILETFTKGEYEKAPQLIEEAGWFIRLWLDLQVIHKTLGELLLTELSKLKNTSADAIKEQSAPSSLLESFSLVSPNPAAKESERKKNQAIILPSPRQEAKSQEPQSVHYDSFNRQSAIVSFLKEKSESGNPLAICRMKEIQDKFPYVSERTLRYDLQKLVEQRMIERVGAGPMSAYRALISAPPEAVTPELGHRYSN
jgi:hypothetical protein